jgi:hypothetical protein
VLAHVLERVIAFAARDEESLVRAREEWAERAGRVFDDDPLYEERASAFLEWFAIDRPEGASPTPGGRTPVERWLAESRFEDLEGRWAHALARSHRSLFAVAEMGEGRLLLEDLAAGAAFEVSERRKLPGVSEGDVFEARLVADIISPPLVLFSRALLFYPHEAAEAVRRLAGEAQRAGRRREDICFLMLRLRLKALRYAHLPADKIYVMEE